ncbi:hypothetical protein ACVWYF_003781 [Hymenobacter sp. UYAg731]
MKQFSTTPPGSGRHFITRLRPYLAALLLLLAAPLARAQAPAPAWQTAQALVGLDVFPVAATTGPGGFVFMVGLFTGTATFGTTQLTSAGSDDIFVTKWDPNTRAFVWAQRAGGNASDQADGVAVQGANVYVTGSFASPTADFGPVTLANANTLAAGNTSDGFLTKFVDAGSTSSFGWTQQFGGGNIEFSNAVAAVGSSVYICGQFRSPTLAFGSTTLVCTGSDNAFVAKLTDAGTTGSFVWAYRAGGTFTDGAEALAVSGSSVYLGGHFTSTTATFGTLTLANAAGNSSDGFLAKLADAGSTAAFTWALSIRGTGSERVNALQASGSSVYLTGAFSSAAVTLGGSTLANSGSGDISAFVAKVTDAGSAGSFTWAQSASRIDGLQALALNGQSIYVAGTFYGAAQFGSTTLTSRGFGDICVAKLTDAGPTGSFVWAQQAGSGDRDLGYALALSGTSVCVAGLIGAGTATFGSLALTNNVPMRSMGYVATLTDATLTATAGPRALPDVAVFPNPAHATATVQLPPVPGASVATLTLTDALGRVVRTATVPLPAAGLRHPLDLAGLPAGLYAVRVAAGGRSATHRLVVE